MFVLIMMDPYESGEVDSVIGPFADASAAKKAHAKLLKAGAHPDAELQIIEITSFDEALADFTDESFS